MEAKVLVVGPSSGGLKGGQVTHMENLKLLFKDVRNQVDYFYSSSGKEGTESSFLKATRLIGMWTLFPFLVFGKKVVHLNTSFDTKAVIRDLLLAFISIFSKKKLIIQYHGGDPDSVGLFSSSLFMRAWGWIISRSHVLVLTDDQFEWVDAKNPRFLKKMLNYVELAEKNNVDNDVPIFLYMGRIIREKGIFELLDVVERNADVNFVVRVCGKGEDEDEFISEIQSRNLSKKVNFVGVVSGSDKDSELRISDVFLYPSYYPEGLPYSVLEALSNECAVICTDAGALETLLEDGVTAAKVVMKDVGSLSAAMNRMVEDKEFRRLIASNGRDLVERRMSLPVLKSVLVDVWHG